MTLVQKRKKLIFGALLLAIVALVIYGIVAAAMRYEDAHKYDGLTLTEEVEMDDATREQVTRRMAVTRSALDIARENNEDPDLNLYMVYAFDASLLGDLVLARETYEEFFEYNAINGAAWSNYGRILANMGDDELALNAFAQAITLEHKEADYRSSYELLRERFEKHAEAKALLEEAVQYIGQTPWLMVALGEWYREQGDCAQAIAHYEVAVSLTPENIGMQQDLNALRTTCN